MKLRELIKVLRMFDPDSEVTVADSDFVVVVERVGPFNGRVPPAHIMYVDINPKPVPFDGK